MPEEKREFTSGVTSTKQPRLSLIPHAGLINAAIAFEIDLQKHGDKAWNSLSNNHSALQDKDWLIERCSHAIEHCYNMIDALKCGAVAPRDAGAVAWCGLVLGQAFSEIIEVTRKDLTEREKKDLNVQIR